MSFLHLVLALTNLRSIVYHVSLVFELLEKDLHVLRYLRSQCLLTARCLHLVIESRTLVVNVHVLLVLLIGQPLRRQTALLLNSQ